MYWKAYTIARSTKEALDYLEQFRGKARVVAGGTDLVVQLMEERSENRPALVDVSSAADMRGIEVSDGGTWIMVGAATTMCELSPSDILARHGKALASGASCMGAPQIRNVATLGGNVVNAQPAADGTIPLLALGAEARTVSAEGAKWTSLYDLFLDVGRSSVDPAREIVTHFRFEPTGGRSASSLQRLAQRKAFTLPILLVAARVELDKEKRYFERVRIAMGPVARTPWLAKEAADAISGERISRDAIQKAAAQARSDAHPRSSLRGGAEYRKEMVEVLVRRALLDCVTSIGASIDA
jgi:carbon-monoxide dehydrogenase medium subunit